MDNYGAIQQRGFLSKKRGGTITGDTLYNPAGAISDILELVNKGYIDAALAGLAASKQHTDVRMASTADIDLGTGGLLTIDTIVAIAGDRVLVTDQAATEENGIYVAGVGTWSRATDMDITAEATVDEWCFVALGAANASTGWKISTAPAALDTNPLLWTQFTGGGVAPASFQPQEDLTAQVADGTPTVFLTSVAYVATSIKVYLNGMRMRLGAGNDYTESDPTIGEFTFTAGSTPLAGDTVVVDLTRV